jgi:hypothetical protein
MWVLGGWNDSCLNDVWSSADGIHWTEATDSASWPRRSEFGCSELGDSIRILGGANDTGYFNDAWVSPDGVNWTCASDSASTAWSARAGLAALTFDNRVWVLGGGAAGVDFDDVWCADGRSLGVIGKARNEPAPVSCVVHPSPFRSSVQASYFLPRTGLVRAVVCNSVGREVKLLAAEAQAAGLHHMAWNGQDGQGHSAPGGVYFLRLVSGGRTLSEKIVKVD